ncbi:hypothetical protein WDW37_16400 [Bdellovibrionota bacterium FG-1]
MWFSKFFKQVLPETKAPQAARPTEPLKLGTETGRLAGVTLPTSPPILSDPPGRFSMYIHDKAMALIEAEGKLTREEVSYLPAKVYEVAEALKLAKKEPVHFILNVSVERTPSDSCMTVLKIVPPIRANNGDMVARSLLIFEPPFRFDMNKAENDFAAVHSELNILGKKAGSNIKLGLIQTRRMNCVTSLCHEMVHLFVTDEHMPRFKGWTLERLEMFTDALTVLSVWSILERSKDDDFVGIGLIQGAAYLSNHLRKSLGGNNTKDMVTAMKELAEKIVIQEVRALSTQPGLTRSLAPEVLETPQIQA